MSFFTQASFVMDPNVYGVGKLYVPKPTDGSGDLTFTRASNGTRVNQDGLIEKVRTNLLLQSNTFNTTWTAANASVTGGQIGYDGTLNAWKLESTASTTSMRLEQSITNANTLAYSIYAKAGTTDWIVLRNETSNTAVWFDLANGIKGQQNASVIYSSIEIVGSGWYRLSVVFNSCTSVRYYVADGDGSFAITLGANVYIQNAQLETGDIATDYIATTSAAVSIGPLANIPRLNYGADGCPSLLLEPQRTNELQFSEQADNAYWTKSGTTISVNATASPSGYVDADKLTEDTSTGTHRYGRATFPSGTQRTLSVFVKKGERNFVSLFENNTVGNTVKGVIFNLNTGTLSLNNDASFYLNPTITSYGNGWYRVSATWTPISLSVPSIGVSADGLTNSYTGTTGSGIYVWGAQLEAGAYATSYIPTLSSAVTRVADSAYKTGMTSVIGQTEGTLFCEIIFKTSDAGTYLSIEDWGNLELVRLYNDAGPLKAQIYNGSSLFVSQTSYNAVVGQSYKMALAYSASGAVFYVNGELVSEITSALSIPTCTNVRLAAFTSGQEMNEDLKQTLLFKTRLSNADLARLTSL